MQPLGRFAHFLDDALFHRGHDIVETQRRIELVHRLFDRVTQETLLAAARAGGKYLTQAVASDGKFVWAEEIRRGPPILHSKEDWVERSRQVSRRYISTFSILVLVLMIPIFIMFYLALEDMGVFPAFMLTLLYPALIILLSSLMEVYYRKKAERLDLYPGLFAGGLQFRLVGNVVLFFPYHEIESFEVVSWPLITTLRMRLRGFKRPIRLNFADTLLGEEGLATLQRMISPEMPKTEPPKLVVYGGRQAKISRIPRRGGLER